MVNQDDIREAMKNIDDPEIGINIVDLGLIYEVIVDEATGKVDLNMTLTSMGCPAGEEILADVRKFVEPLEGVTSLEINMVWSPPWGPDKMTDDGKLLMKVMGHG